MLIFGICILHLCDIFCVYIIRIARNKMQCKYYGSSLLFPSGTGLPDALYMPTSDLQIVIACIKTIAANFAHLMVRI